MAQKKVFEYVRQYAETKGIASLDVGTLKENGKGSFKWETVQTFCDKKVAWIHPLISDFFEIKFKGKQPINYLYEYWRESDKEDEIIQYSFSRDGYLDPNSNTSVQNSVEQVNSIEEKKYQLSEIKTEGNNYSSEEGKNEVSSPEKEAEVKKILEDECARNSIDWENNEGESQEALFIKSQALFTKLVLASFNHYLDAENPIKYVTIVLLRKRYDGKWHLSYNAAIFSNNLSYLDSASVKLLFDCISHENYDNEIAALKQNVRRESIKSAVSAIMSRNMSHNLGSHFISNTKNYFGALIERAKDTENESNYRGIKHALQYIQERMDFIATITSTDVYPLGAVNAKAQIFDELALDDFYQRHKKKNCAYNFLMDYLVLSEKISKQSSRGQVSIGSSDTHRLVLQISLWDGDKKASPEYWSSSENTDVENAKRDKILGINFAIPGGILGRHAVFSIIENVIRNSAKHGQDKIQDGDFIIRLLYRTDEQRLIIFDNKKDTSINSTVENIENRLKLLHFLDETGALAQDNKGLKEMLICAIWLQNENVAQVISDYDSLSIDTEEERMFKLCEFSKYLRVVKVNDNGIELNDDKTIGFLGYSIKLDMFEKIHYFNTKPTLVDLKAIKADIICANEDYIVGEGDYAKKLSKIFPRFKVVTEKANDPEDVLRDIVEQNCGKEAVNKKMVVSYETKYEYTSPDILLFDYWPSYKFIESQPRYDEVINIKEDIIYAKEDYKVYDGVSLKSLSEIIPSHKLRTPNSIEDFLSFKENVEKAKNNLTKQENDNICANKEENVFIFKGHAAKSKWDVFRSIFQTPGVTNQYVDAISGGDFTYTIVQPTFANIEYNLLKIKESVATRFIIIDERIYEHYIPEIKLTTDLCEKIVNGLEKIKTNYTGDVLAEKMASYIFSSKAALGNGIYESHKSELIDFVKDENRLSHFLEKDLEQSYLERKGIFVFNLEANETGLEANKTGFTLSDLSNKKKHFSWNAQTGFMDNSALYFEDNEYNKVTTFLSIHLGLIDKIKEHLLKAGAKDDSVDGEIVAALEHYFGASFVSIHSGRGGFDVRESLKQYTFQSFSAIENPLYNSKYLLSQQFYNLSYHGGAKQ